MLTDNKILEDILDKRKGLYVHALEVNDAYELECCIEQLTEEFINDYPITMIVDFITTMEIYYLGDDEDEERRVYNFDIMSCIKSYI